ncbi:unnamed protein product [Paramecium sonneborni]|uniref:P-type ATPase A domain-containing protein n=1 Tax=Paramecium sonneborni TaxID=65129 RepID=A0A8S1LEW2_9CILI|nr:unnamed protein product [Paramecium sonneborni]
MSYRVNNAEIEGQHPLLKVTPVRFLRIRLVLTIIISIMTGCMFALALRWSKKLYNWFLFTPCNVEETGTHYRVDTQNGQQFTLEKQQMNGIYYFTFRLLKYAFDPKTQCYQPIEFETDGKIIKDIIGNRNVLTQNLKIQYYGKCQLQIPIQPLAEFLFEHLTGPFNILQYFAVAVWFAQNSITFPILILAFTAIAVVVNYILYRRSRSLLQKLANIHQDVTLKSDTLRTVNGSELLPGDYIILKEGQQLNCDCAILQGDVMVNEATLTGENVPIPKTSLPDHSVKFNFEQLNQHCLFEGTSIVKVNSTTENYAIVLRTGFSSLRGQYFRNVLFPAPPSQRFYVQAAKFILSFATIIAIVYGFMLIKYIPMEFKTSLLVLRFLDNIVWSIPPSMPIFFNICKTASLVRLGSIGINGSNADKIESAGRIDTCCFDKTGTLTTLGLKAIQVWTHDQQLESIANYILACCHHLLLINGELQGDPLEIEMLNFIGWKINFEGKAFFSVKKDQQEFEIIKIFDFSSARQMMSVIATDGSNFYLFSKGSPEMINQQSQDKKQVVLDEVKKYASNGFRVLGLGYRKLNNNQLDLQREELETQLNIVGMFVLENPLKDDTPQVIQTLRNSGLDIKVISGDSPLTTIYCAKISGIIDFNSEVIILDYNQSKKQIVIFDNEDQAIYDENIVENQNIIEQVIQNPKMTAVTGKFLEFISKFLTVIDPNRDTTITMTQNNSSNQIFTENNAIEFDDTKMKEITMKLISKTRVFARQKPEQKKQIVALLQEMGRQVMMTGDGANDCSAIAQAQVGISFSESDASYTAPFSSKSTSLKCCIQVLAQGKAAIMTIIEVFQYQLSVNGIKFAAVTIMFLEVQNFSEFQTVYVGFISNIPLLIFLCISSPATELAEYIPLDDQFSYQNQIQIYTNIFFAVLGLCINYGILITTDRFFEYSKPIEKFQREGYLNSLMFLSLMYYFMSFGVSIYVSNPFKVKYYKNILLTLWTTLGFVVAIVSFIFPQRASWCDVIDIREDTFKGFNWVILTVVIVTSFFGFFVQALFQRYIPSMYKITHKK